MNVPVSVQASAAGRLTFATFERAARVKER